MKKPVPKTCRFLCPPVEVSLDQVEVTYSQPSDSCGGEDGGQILTIRSQSAGEGSFVTLETRRWAVEPQDAEWLADAIREICRISNLDDLPVAKGKPSPPAE